MTQRELDSKMYELRSAVADKFKDIQMQSNALKNPEDISKNNQTMTKISDNIADIKKLCSEIALLETETPDDEEDEYSSYGSRFLAHSI